jgi:hypothetical protein
MAAPLDVQPATFSGAAVADAFESLACEGKIDAVLGRRDLTLPFVQLSWFSVPAFRFHLADLVVLLQDNIDRTRRFQHSAL